MIAGLDDLGTDHDTTLYKELRTCRKANLNCTKTNAFSDVPTFLSLEKSFCGMV